MKLQLSQNPLWQSSIIIISLLFVAMWNRSAFTVYSSQFIALFIFLYVFSSLNKKTTTALGEYSQPLQISILIVVSTLLVLSTGELSSSLFFLLYFILFAVALIFKPQTVFVLAAGLVGIFLLGSLQKNLTANLPTLVSLLFISPLAFYFGREFQKTREVSSVSNADEIVQKIDSDVNQIVSGEKTKLSTQSIKNLGDIVEQAEKLSSKDEK